MPEGQFEILIKTVADLAAAQQTKAALQDQVKAAKALGQDSTALEGQLKKVDTALRSETANAVRLTEAKKQASAAAKLLGKDTSEFGKALAEIGHHIPGFEKLSGLFTKLSAGGAAAGLGGILATLGTALAGVAVAGVHEFAKSEEAVARLDAALAQSGNLIEDYRKRLQDLASQLQATTSIADEEWLGVLRTLTQFGSTPQSIGMDVEAVKNLAGIMGGDLQGAAMLVARALEGNFDLFRRHGIIIEDTGTKAEKLSKLYEQLALRGFGQLEARGKTLTGQWQLLKNNFSDLLEIFGGIINRSGILQSVVGGLNTFFEAWNEKLGETVPKLDGLSNAARRTVHSFDDAKTSADKFKKGLENLKEDAESTAKAVQNLTDEIRRLQRFQDDIEGKEKARQLAAIEEAEGGGALSKSAALRRRANIEEEYARKKVERDQKANRDALAAEEFGLTQGLSRQKMLEAAVTQGKKDLPREVSAESQKTKLGQLESELKKAQEDLENAPHIAKGYMPDFQEQIASLQRRTLMLERLRDYERARTPALIANSEESRRALEQAKQLLELTTKQNKEQKEKVDLKRREIDQENRFIQHGAQIERETRQIRTRTELRDVRQNQLQNIHREIGGPGGTRTRSALPSQINGQQKGDAIEKIGPGADEIVLLQRLMHGVKPEQSWKQIYADATKLAAGLQGNREGLFSIMTNLLAHVNAETRERQELGRQIALLGRRQAGLRNR